MKQKARVEALERQRPGTPIMSIMLVGCAPSDSGPTPTSACRLGGGGIIRRREGEAAEAFTARAERELFPDAETLVVLPTKRPAA